MKTPKLDLVEKYKAKTIDPVKIKNLNLDLSKNNVICGDCKDWLEKIPPNSIDLIYIDPPFFSNKTYEIIWGNGFELRSFDDRFKGGIEHYIDWMRERLIKAYKTLAPTGSFFLHCDYRANYRLRMLLNEIFSEKCFLNEIIWSYFKPHAGKKTFPKNHDTILWYAKNKEKYFFNKKFSLEDYDEKAKKRYDKIDKHGNRYKIYNNKNGTQRIAYMKTGKPVDVFVIPFVQGTAKERIGYKTQKPEGLIKKLIECTTKQNNIVLDFFGGGGTTAKVAYDLGRRFIIGDVSPVAVQVIKEERLKNRANCYDFIDCNPYLTKEEWKGIKGHEFANKVCEYMAWVVNTKKSGDGGIDGWVNDTKKIPVQIKNSDVNVAPVRDLAGVCTRYNYKSGIIVGWSFSKGCYEFVSVLNRKSKIKIELKKADTIVQPISSIKKAEWEKLYSKRVKEFNKKAA